jgi:hypothetical protein
MMNLIVGPTNSFVPVVKLTPTSGRMRISWNSISGKAYQVCYKTNLTDIAWTPTGPLVTAVSSNSSYTDTPAAGARQRFYNVQIK